MGSDSWILKKNAERIVSPTDLVVLFAYLKGSNKGVRKQISHQPKKDCNEHA